MSLYNLAQQLQSAGRGDDTVLMHVTPGEVQGLQKLAMSQGGSLTINPHTGLAEAGFLSSMLPTIIGLGITAASGGTIPGWMIGAGVGGATALASGSLKKGLMAGLGAYGGSELGGSLSSMGAQQAQGLVGAETNAAAELAGSQAQKTALDAETARQATATAEAAGDSTQTFYPPKVKPSAFDEYGAPWGDRTPTTYMEPGLAGPMTSMPAPTFSQNPAQFAADAQRRAIDEVGLSFRPPAESAAGQALANPMRTGLGQLTEKGGISALGSKLGYGGAAAIAAPLLYGMTQQKQPSVNAPPAGTNSRYVTKFDPKTGQYYGSYIDTYNKNDPNSFNVGMPASYSSPTPPVPSSPYPARNAAQGGLLDSMEQNSYPQARLPLQHMSRGGLEDTQEYAAGGKLLRGPGDGMSDSIPAVIKGAKPQRAALADGEFVIPADVVSHLGNGSTEAGAKRLYSMMDKVRHARTGNPKQGKQINPERFMPA